MIKVAFVIPTLDRSGAERQLTLLATALPRDEFSPHVIALTRGGPFQADLEAAGVPVSILHKRFRFDPLAVGRLRRQLKRLSPEIIHSWLFAANTAVRLPGTSPARSAIVCSERCVDSWKSRWQLWLDRRLASRTTRLLANSEAVREFYCGLGVAEDLVEVIPNGVATPVPADRAELLRELDLPENARVVGYVGRLARQKRVADLAWAFQLLRQVADNTYFVIVGAGPEQERLTDHLTNYGCRHLVRMTGHREDAARFFSAFDVFWLASDFEGMSNSVLEAMASGVPVVASDIAPNRELIRHGQTGYLVNVGDSVAFQQFAQRLLEDPAHAAEIAARATARAADTYSVDEMVRAHVRLYHAIAAGD